MKTPIILLLLLFGFSSLAQNQTACFGSLVYLTIPNSQNLSNPIYTIQPSGQITNSPGTFFDYAASNTTYTLFVTGQNSQQVTVTNSITIALTVAPNPTFSYYSQSNNYSITCVQPSITLKCGTSYTFGTLTYNLTGPSSFSSNQATTTLTQPGIYTITAIDPSTTCSLTNIFSIGINTTIPVSLISPTLQTITCSQNANSVVLTATNPTNNITHRVYSPFGTIAEFYSPTAYFYPGSPATYTYEIKNLLNGCTATKQFTVVSTSGFPTFSLNSAPPNYTLGCGTKSVIAVNFSNLQSPGGGIPTFTILPPGSSGNLPPGNLGNQNTYTLFIPGTWTAVVRNSIDGCESRIPFTVIWNAISPKLDSLANPYSILNCSNPQTTLQAFSYAPNVSYYWNISGNATTYSTSTIVAKSQTATPSQTLANIYQITIMDNNNWCKSTNSITIKQNLFPPKPAIGANIKMLSCSNQTIQMVNNSSTGIPAGVFPTTSLVVAEVWAAPSQPTVGFTSSYDVYTPGQTTLTALDLNNGCRSTTVVMIGDNRIMPQVSPLPGIVNLCNEPSVQISPIISGTAEVLTFNWIAPLGATFQGPLNTSTLKTNSAGIFTLQVSNQQGCKVSLQFTVGICVSVFENQAENPVIVYPNPVRDELFISGSSVKAELLIFNLQGELIRREILNNDKISMDVTGLQPGIYLIKLQSDNYEENRRLIKE